MKKKLLAVLFCVIMVITLLPATALAVQDISTTGLDLSTAPTVKTTYHAGGIDTVTWDPTVTPVTLTFENATMEVESSSAAVILPTTDNEAVVNVVFKGTNNITALSDTFATVLSCNGKTTITLSPGSDTTLNAGDGHSYAPRGIYCNSYKYADSLTITGSGRLRVDAVCSLSSASAYAIDASSRLTRSLFLNGGTLDLSGSVTGNITLGGFTIPSGSNLYLQFAESYTKGETGAVINSELHMKDGTTLANINELGFTGSGLVVVGGSSKYLYVEDEWVTYDNDDFFDGLDLSGVASSPTAAPTVKTAYRAGEGTVVWNPTMSGDPAAVTGGTLTLNSAQIKLGGSDFANFFKLPNVPVTIELKGTSTLSTADEGAGTVPNTANFFSSLNSVELTGTGSIDSTTSGCFIKSEDAVTLNGGTRSGSISAASAVLNGVTIPENGELNLQDVTGDISATDTVNNGRLILKRSADIEADTAAILSLNLPGSGCVEAKGETSTLFNNDGTLFQYSITGGQNGQWTKGDSDGLCFTADAYYAKFTGVSVDGTTISGDDYSSQSGSTIVTLNAAYLQSLSTGLHTMRISFNDGFAETHFTVKTISTGRVVPLTGISTHPALWLGAMIVAATGIFAGAAVIRRKRTDKAE